MDALREKTRGKKSIPIALVIPKYGLMGGAESVVFEMAERLARMEPFTVHVLAHRWRSGGAPVRFHRIPMIPFPRALQPISFARFADRWIRRHPEVLIHSHERICRMDLLTFHGIPHRIWIEEIRKKRLGLFDWATDRVERSGLVNPGPACILPVSSLVKEALLQRYDIHESRIRVLSPGIDLNRFKNLDREACRRDIRARHGLTPSDTVILFMGMNFEIKRLGLVMGGMARAMRRCPGTSWKLLVAGKGDYRRFKALARDLDIRDRVVFTGPVTPVEPYFLAADLFAMPSRMDTFGMVVLEAMAAGIPVIISGKVGARDLVKTGAHGFVLSDSPEPEEMGEVLVQLADPVFCRHMGEKARQKAAVQSWDTVLRPLVRIYFRLHENRHL